MSQFSPDMPDESVFAPPKEVQPTMAPMFSPDMPPGYDRGTTQAVTRQTANMTSDMAVEDMLLAARVNAPADLVSRNRDYFRNMDLAQQVDEVLNNAPAVRALYNANPLTAGLIRDDLDNVVELEQIFTDYQPPLARPHTSTQAPFMRRGNAVPSFTGAQRIPGYELSSLERIPVAAMEGAAGLAENGLSFLSGLLNTYTPTAQDIDQYLPGQGQAAIENLKAGLAQQPLAGGLERHLKEYRDYAQSTALKPTGNGVQDFVEDFVRMGPQFAAQVITYAAGGYIPVAAFMFTQISGGQYAQLTEDEAQDKARAFLASLVNAGVQTPLEALAAGKVLDIFKGTGLANVFKAGASAMLTEFVTEWAQAYPEALTSLWAEAEHKGRSGEDTLRYFADNFWEYTKQGMYEGAVASLWGLAGGAGKVGYEYGRYRVGKEDGAFFAALDESAQGSRTRERLPQEYQRVVSAITEGGPVENVYVSPQAMRGAMENDTAFYQLAENVGLTREEIARAEEMGADVEIPLALYQTHIAGTETSLKIRDSVKFHPEDMSLAERMEFERFAPEQLAEALKRIEADATANAELDAALAPIAEQLSTLYGKEAADANINLLKARARISADWWTEAGEPLTPAQVVTDKWRLTLETTEPQAHSSHDEGTTVTASPAMESVQEPPVDEEIITQDTPAGNISAPVRGESISISMADGSELPGRYEVRDAAAIIPSHDPLHNFQKREDYPADTQERPYHSSADEQLKVRNHAARLDVRFVINGNPDAVNGPPIVTEEGIVLGGNSRAMSIQLAFAEHPDLAQNYKDMLKAKAAAFGLDPAHLDAMQAPMLVRVAEGTLDAAQQARLVRVMNQSRTQGLDANAEAVSRGRLVSEHSLAVIANAMQEHDTLLQYLASPHSRALVDALEADGVMEATQRARMTNSETGLLNEEGKRFVQLVLRGRAIPNFDIVDAAPASVLQAIDRILPQVASMQALGGAWDLTPTLMGAVRQIIKWKASGHKRIDTYFNQGNMLADAERDNPAVRTLARLLAEAKPTQFAAAFARYADLARQGGSGMTALPGVTMPTPETAFQKAFEAPTDLTFHQDGFPNVNKRGSIIFTDSGAVIRMFRDSADFSTFAHESAHLFMHDMEALIATGNAPAQVVEDYARLQEFVNEFKSDDALQKYYDLEFQRSRPSFKDRDFSTLTAAEKGTVRNVAEQEKLADAFLTYLQEGRAPSPELRGAFRRFKDWLKGLYQSLMGKVQINDDVRAVFDRMLATDADMALVEELHSIDAKNVDAVNAVAREMLTEAEQRRLEQLRGEASAASREKGLKLSLRALLNSTRGMRDYKTQAHAQVSAKPVYQAMDAAMGLGGISRQSLVSEFGEEVAQELGKKRVGMVRKEGGVDIQDLALAHGFESADALVLAMRDAQGKIREVSAMVKEEAARREAELRKEMSVTEGMPGEEEYYNDARLRSLLLEMRALERKAAGAGRTSSTSGTAGMSRQWAKDILGAMSVREALSVGRHAAAEARAAAEAAKALKDGRTEDAAASKRRQAINHAMVLEALDLQKRQRAMLRDLRRWAKSKDMNFECQEQILALAQRYGIGGKRGEEARFAPRKPDERANLGQFMEALAEDDIMGMPPYPDFILAESAPPNMSMGQMSDVYDVMRWLAEQGRPGEARMISEGMTGTVKDVAAQGAAILATSGNVAPVYEEGTLQRTFSDRWRAIFSALNEFKDQMMKADGYQEIGKKGSHKMGFHSQWHQRINDAHNAMVRIFREEVRPEQARIERIRDDFIRRFAKQYGKRVAEINGVQTPENMRAIGRSMWTAEHIWCLARNMGNAGNVKSVTQGYGLDMAQLQALTSVLTANEWLAVQAEGVLMSRFYERTDDVFRKVYGRPMPDKVQAQELTVSTADGQTITLSGWYFPLSVDSKLDQDTKDKKQADIVQADPNFTAFGPSLSRSHTKARTGTSKPAGLYFDVFERALTDQLRFLTHAPVLRDFDRMTRNPEWRKAYVAAFGQQEYDKIRPMLKYLSRPQSENVGSLDGFLARQRQLASLFILGWNVRTVLRQFQGLMQAAPEVGWGNILTGMSRVLRSPGGMVSAVDSLSPFIADRRMGWDREMREATRNFKTMVKVRVGNKTYSEKDVHEFTMAFVRVADTAATYSIWQGAYENGLNKLGLSQREAIVYADRVVQKTNASATPVDLTPLQREGGVWRLFTMFMGEPMRKGSRMRLWWGAYQSGKIGIGEYANHLFHETLFPALYFTALVGLLSDDEPDWKDYTAAVLGETMGVMPILSQLSGAIQYKKPITQSTVFTGVESALSLVRAGKSVSEDPNDPEAWARVYKSTVDIAAYSVGAGNVRRLYETAAEGWDDLQFGQTHNPFRLFFRKSKQ